VPRYSSCLQYFHQFVDAFTSRCVEHNLFAGFFTDNGFPSGEVTEMRPFSMSGFFWADQLVFNVLAGIHIFKHYRAGKNRPVLGQIVHVDDFCIAQFVSQFTEPAFDKGLAFFGGIIFGIFTEIAMGTCLFNGPDDTGPFVGFKVFQLFFQLSGTLFSSWVFFPMGTPKQFSVSVFFFVR
jgi:hypothetical protein